MARKVVEKNISFDDIKKKYYVNFDYGKDENKKRIKKTKTFDKKSDAKKALKEFEADKTKGQLVIPKEITLAEWLDNWYKNIVLVNLEITTSDNYKNIIQKHINPFLGKIPLQQLKPQQIQQYYANRIKEGELSSNTVLKHHVLLKTALGVAVKQDIILRNPIDRVEPPKKVKPEIHFYNVEQLKQLNEMIEGSRLEIVVKLAMYLGLRREEICGLKWLNIDFDNKIITIKDARTMTGSQIVDKKTKNETSTRCQSAADALLEALTREKEKQKANKEFLGDAYFDSDFVVVMEDGKPYRPNYISELFTKFIENNNLPKLTLHGIRHSFASLTNAVGISQFNASKMLGHSTPATTSKIYTHMYDESHKEEMKRIAEALK